ncbi:MAG: hypothetical protein WDO13_12545 [Verrucomicrobiota bacterium]
MSELAKSGTIKVHKSIMKRAILNDRDALGSIFSQFLSPDEQIYALEYLGTQGLWGLGKRSFTCLTDRRIASLRTGAFGELVYQDGFLEHINSGVIYQPSRLGLYINVVVATVLAIGAAIFLGAAAAQAAGNSFFIFPLVAIPVLVVALPILWFIAVRLYYRVPQMRAGLGHSRRRLRLHLRQSQEPRPGQPDLPHVHPAARPAPARRPRAHLTLAEPGARLLSAGGGIAEDQWRGRGLRRKLEKRLQRRIGGRREDRRGHRHRPGGGPDGGAGAGADFLTGGIRGGWRSLQQAVDRAEPGRAARRALVVGRNEQQDARAPRCR